MCALSAVFLKTHRNRVRTNLLSFGAGVGFVGVRW